MEMGHVARGVGELVVGQQHRAPVGAALVLARLDAEVALQALVEVVAGFGAGSEEPSGRQRAENLGQAQPALHPQPEAVELGVVGDDGGDRKDIRQRAEVVAHRHQVEHPDWSILAA